MEINKEFSEKAKQDFRLINKAIETGDEKAYAELLNRYRKPLFHMLLKMVSNVDDAEDLTIEAFAKAFKSLNTFNPEFTFSTWLFKIATNNCIDFIRKKKINTYSIDSSATDSSGEEKRIDIKDLDLNPQEETIKVQKIKIIQDIVTKLPPKYRRLIELRYFKELSYNEIAKELNAPLGTIKAQLHRGRELLYEMVKHKRDSI